MRQDTWRDSRIAVSTEAKFNADSTDQEGINLTISAAKLMQLLHDGHLVASDIHCLGDCSKRCVQSLLLRCVRKKM